MQRVRAVGAGQIEVIDAPIPSAGPGQVLVASGYAGICGTDTHAIVGGHALLHPPYLPGHEAMGTIAALGDGVEHLQVGQRVALKPNLPCGTCITCLTERSNACQTLAWIGCDPSDTWPGAMAEYFVAPASALYPISDAVDDETAVLIECLATPVHAVRLADPDPGARVLVIGAGTIGFLTVLAAKAAGVGPLVVSDLDPAKRDRAVAHGADAAVDPNDPQWRALVADALGPAADGRELGSAAADVVFDCVANQASTSSGIGVLRRAGTLMVVGIPAGDYAVAMGPVADWELRIQGSANYTETDYAQAVELAESGAIPTVDIVTERFPFSRAAEAFAAASQNSSGKVLVHP